jgi:hypothetical protein
MKHDLAPQTDEIPELSEADFASAQTFANLPVGLQAKLKGGRPKVEDAKEVVIARYKAKGANWRALMEQAITEGLALRTADED